MELNYLKYASYKTCPLQYKWRFVQKPTFWVRWDRTNAFIGLLLMKLVERFYQEKWWSLPDCVERMRKAIPTTTIQILAAEKIYLSDEIREKWNQVAHDTVPTIVNAIREYKFLSDDMYVEREEEVPLSGTEDVLQLRPDFVIFREAEYTLLDGKGGSTVGRYVDNDQLYFYAGALESIYKRLPDRLGFWWFRHGKLVLIPITPEHVETVRDKARGYVAGIKAGLFEAKPGSHCRLCDYRVGCDKGKEFLESKVKIDPVEIPGNFGEVGFGD